MHMIYRSSQLHAKDYISSLAASGRYHFLSSDARKALGVSADATKLALNRLARQKMIAQPARGFYVIVPPEYRALGCLPADQFIPALMERLDQPYYAGLLSAAQYHGAAHHRPQEFQVLLERARRPLSCGHVRAKFIVRNALRQVPVQSFKTPRGLIHASTPEATAVDLVGYYGRVGGLDQVATVLLELVERIDPQKLLTAAQCAPIAWAQRLGYLLDSAGAREPTGQLRTYVRAKARQTVPLLPGVVRKNAQRDGNWKILVNVDIEPDL
ncbi:MAG: type IV toxin-antitoxin system AbiEi family antitoxin [Acidobacteriota bacterium]|nr:type IV toxin-antitoxin system AbiEi family antitoxin [Acidobacteriota bacterium]